MSTEHNDLVQPVGPAVTGWQSPPLPGGNRLVGRTCQLAPLVSQHVAALYDAIAVDRDGRNWTYMMGGPFDTQESFADWIAQITSEDSRRAYAIVLEATGHAAGMACYLRLCPEHGRIEIGTVMFSPVLQKTVAATEAIYLMLQHVFELGYRRCEWKCDSLNAASRRAALRFGFTYEGTFRNDVVYKARNRDTAWFTIIDSEWPALKRRFEQWLDRANFDDDGQQRRSLESFG